METNETNLIFWVVLFTMFLLGIFVLPAFRLKRAILQVIRIFRRHASFCFSNPKTIDELGLAPRPMWESLFRLRDFKPYAIQVLLRGGVIHLSDDGKMCMQENKAAEFLTASGMRE
jgi:hypothetical protein